MNNNKILIAKIVKAQGLKGEFKIVSYAQENSNIIKYKEFTDDSNNHYKLKNMVVRNNSLYLKFEGYNDRNQVESLIGLNLYIYEDKLEKLENEEFYHYQLIGLKAMDQYKSKLGEISSIHNFGAGDIIEIIKEDNSTIYIPFDKNFIDEINIKEKYIIIPSSKEF